MKRSTKQYIILALIAIAIVILLVIIGSNKSNEFKDYQYIIEVSMDGSNWTKVVDRSNNTESGSLLFDTFEPIDCKYMKLTLEGAHTYTGKWYNINELFIFKTNK